MNRFPLLVALALALFVAVPAQTTHAQASIELGPRVGVPLGDYSADFVEDAGLESTFFIGGEARISSIALPFDVAVTGDFYLTDPPEGSDTSVFLLGADAIFPFGIDNQVFTPYLAVGPRLSFNTYEFAGADESSTDFGLGARFGAKFGFGGVTPFVEVGYNLIFNGKIDEEATELDRETARAFGIGGGLLFGL